MSDAQKDRPARCSPLATEPAPDPGKPKSKPRPGDEKGGYGGSPWLH